MRGPTPQMREQLHFVSRMPSLVIATAWRSSGRIILTPKRRPITRTVDMHTFAYYVTTIHYAETSTIHDQSRSHRYDT